MLRRLLKSLADHWRKPPAAAPAAVYELIARALACQKAGRLAEAENIYRQALQLEPDHLDSLHLLGNLLKIEGRPQEAVELLERLIARDPGRAEAHYHLAGARQACGRLEAALRGYDKAIELKRDFTAAHNNRASILQTQGALNEAIEGFRTALRTAPDSAEVYNNLGRALRQRGEIVEAIACHARALELQPDSADLHFSYAMALLQAGQLERGWQEYEWRFEQGFDPPRRRPFALPVWRGEDLSGKTILVWGEQGVGDEIRFAALLPDIILRAGRCVYECAPKLEPLFARSFPQARIVPRSDPPHADTLGAIDLQIAIGSAARWLRPTLASFPDRHHYLTADPARVGYWRERVAAEGPGLKVGFNWRSSNLSNERSLYCPSLEDMDALFKVPGVCFINLQTGDCAAELRAAEARCGAKLKYFAEIDLFNDLAEAAALTSALDLVITAPTTVSVLSAALGVPTWSVTYAAHWDTHGTDHMPWHASMRTIRRFPPRSWSELMAQVADELRGEVERRRLAS